MPRSLIPILLAAALGTGCLSSGNLKPTAATVAQAVRPGPGDALLVGAGDIARCDSPDEGPRRGDEEAGDLVRSLLAEHPEAKVFTAGDNAYPDGTAYNFEKCYGDAWGSFKAQTLPSPGNHEYHTPGAGPYFDYFNGAGNDSGPAGERGKGYYSVDLGDWHLVSLNSELLDPHRKDRIDPGQLEWLEHDLAATARPCLLAFWHRPWRSSGAHGVLPFDKFNGHAAKDFWQVLDAHGADVILNGHDHDYERFRLLDGQGAPAAAGKGIREFVVGTGGGDLRRLLFLRSQSEAQLALRFGILALTLHPDSYEWAFLGTDGKVYDFDPRREPTQCRVKPDRAAAGSRGRR